MRFLSPLATGLYLLAPLVSSAPEVTLPGGTKIIGYTAQNIDSFTGISFAQPPIGPLRLRPPLPVLRKNGTNVTIQATGIPQGCPQFSSAASTTTTTTNSSNSNSSSSSSSSRSKNIYLDRYLSLSRFQKRDTNSSSTNSSSPTPGFGEDCLNLNVQRPANITKNSKLPVIFWIYGGGFEFGDTQAYNASSLINTSVIQGKEIVFVAPNYRVGAFGFMPGKEILADGSANLGLLDQRLALQW